MLICSFVGQFLEGCSRFQYADISANYWRFSFSRGVFYEMPHYNQAPSTSGKRGLFQDSSALTKTNLTESKGFSVCATLHYDTSIMMCMQTRANVIYGTSTAGFGRWNILLWDSDVFFFSEICLGLGHQSFALLATLHGMIKIIKSYFYSNL